MSTVQDIRNQIFLQSKAVEVSKYPFLANLNLASIKAMGNEDQEFVDLQIKCFAYWKTFKKRFIDNVQQAARADLVTSPVNTIKRALTEIVTQHSNITSLMPPPARLSLLLSVTLGGMLAYPPCSPQ